MATEYTLVDQLRKQAVVDTAAIARLREALRVAEAERDALADRIDGAVKQLTAWSSWAKPDLAESFRKLCARLTGDTDKYGNPVPALTAPTEGERDYGEIPVDPVANPIASTEGDGDA